MPTDTLQSPDSATPTANGAHDAPVLKGSEIFVRALEEEGVDRVFGHPGGAVIKIYDAMERIQPSYDHVPPCSCRTSTWS